MPLNIFSLAYKTIIESVLMYGAEQWIITKYSRNEMLALQMDHWKPCCGLGMDRVRNVEIRRRVVIDIAVIEMI